MKNNKSIILIIGIIVLIGVIILFFFSTNKDATETKMPYKENVSFNNMFVLPKGKVVTVGDELKVKLLEVGDSRCPENAKCIWSGEITYKIKVEDSENRGNIELGTVRTKEEEFDDYTISLDDLNSSTEYVRLIVKKG